MRKVEALTTQLLDECGSLPLDVKPDAVAAIASKFVERLQPEHLAKIAEQFADAVARDAAADGGEAWERGAHGQEEDVVVIAEDDAEDAGELRKGEGHDDGARGFEATQELIDKMQAQKPAAWPQAWRGRFASRADDCPGLAALFEAAAASGAVELAAKVAVELVRARTVEMTAVEAALKMLSQLLEDLVQTNESAWHLHSHAIASLFPRSISTPWGCTLPNWDWGRWWLMVEKVLSAADQFRAFDIMVLVLQMIQERSGKVLVKDLQVWKEGRRCHYIRKVMRTWGEMDDASICETLRAYGVEL